MPAKRILFGFLLCLALWLVVLAAQALTLGTEKSLFPYRTEQVACVEFQNGTTGARHLDKAQRVIQDVICLLYTSGLTGSPRRAAAAAAWAASATPVPRAAERTTTGHPSRRDSRSRFSFWPRRSSRSARFTATTMGIPSSSSWVVR